MAYTWPDEGLDFLLTIVPGGEVAPTTLWLGLFTSQNATTTPAPSAVLATQAGVTEVQGQNYSRQAVLGTGWNAPVHGGTGRQRTTAGPIQFPPTGIDGWGVINGFFLANASTAGVALFYCNFDDGLAIVSELSDIIIISPTLRYDR